jgi:hypothetical protein
VGGGVEVHAVDDALQERVFPGDGPHVGGDAFADLVGELADDGPDRLLGIVRHERQVEADELVVGLGELEGLLARADLLGDAVQLVIEDVAEALGEDEREDVVLVFRRVLGAADGAGGVPDPAGTVFQAPAQVSPATYPFRNLIKLLRASRFQRSHFRSSKNPKTARTFLEQSGF